MTERLYYDNAYLTTFDACVQACEANRAFFDVLLDRSAFYPTSGGQPFDTGSLGDGRVVDVYVKDGAVWHTVTKSFDIGEKVQGRIDWERRFDHMQQHAADHMIAGTLHRLMGGVTIGLHISNDISTIDVAMPQGVTRISNQDVRRIEMEVNERIQRDVPIRCWFPTEEELEVLPLRKKPTVSEHVRIVAIGDDEMVACGGTHPSSAGQLGLVKIVSVTPARGKMRVAFLAGQRALKNYFKCFEAAHSTAELISANIDQLHSGVMSLQEKLRETEIKVSAMQRKQLDAQMTELIDRAETLPGGGKLICGFVDADIQLLRKIVSELIDKPGVIALLGTASGDEAAYVFGRSADIAVDLGKLLREAAQHFGGKGGGRPDFAQGGGSAQILDAACSLVRRQ